MANEADEVSTLEQVLGLRTYAKPTGVNAISGLLVRGMYPVISYERPFAGRDLCNQQHSFRKYNYM